MMLVYVLVAMLGAAATLFTLQNPEPVTLTFLQWQSVKLPLAMLMLCSALSGILLAALSGFAQQIQLHRRIHHLEHRLAEISGVPKEPLPARVKPAPERAVPERAVSERMDSPLPRV